MTRTNRIPASPLPPAPLPPFLGPGLMAMTGLGMLWWSWGKWPDPLVDFGRELYLAWQISEGGRLYLDLAYSNGPLSPHLNALWLQLFGVSLRSLVWGNLLLLALITVLLHRLLLKMADRLSAAVAGITFLILFAFAQLVGIGNYNYVCPYSHEMSHGILLTLIGFTFLARYLRSPRLRWLGGVGGALGLLFLTRAEVFLAGGIGLALGVGLAIRSIRWPPGGRSSCLAVFVSSAMIPVLLAWGSLARSLPWNEAGRAVLGNWPYLWAGKAASLPFFQAGLGLLEPQASVTSLLEWLGCYALLLVPGILLARPVGKSPPFIRWICAVLLSGWVLGTASWVDLPRDGMFRPLPVILLGVLLVLALSRVRRSGWREPRWILALSMASWALVLLAKMILNARIHHYGFALAMPATMMSVVALLGWGPAWLEARGGWGNLLRLNGGLVLILVMFVHLPVMSGWFQLKSNSIGSGADRFESDWRSVSLNAALREIRARVGAESSLLVVPEGAMLNFLSRRRSAGRHTVFMPTELAFYGEDRILADLRADPPEFLALVHKDTREFGYRFFGKDYARNLGEWIEEEYRPLVVIGAVPLRDDRFGVALWGRRRSPEPSPLSSDWKGAPFPGGSGRGVGSSSQRHEKARASREARAFN